MTLIALGTLTVGAALPGAALAAQAGVDGIAAAAPDLDAQLDALAHFEPLPTIDLAAQLTAAEQILASVQSALALTAAGVLPPVPPMLGQVAALQLTLDALRLRQLTLHANAAVCAQLDAQLAVGGVEAYAYSGARGSFGGELAAALGGGSEHVHAVALLTSNPATWAALQAVVKVTP